jgi:predicted nucleic acid-binding Zn ribbon protein
MAKGPQRIGEIVTELMSRRGYANVQTSVAWQAAWREVAGAPLAAATRVGKMRRGVLEVVVANSVLVQELTYRKTDLLAGLGQQLPEEKITDLRFRVGTMD